MCHIHSQRQRHQSEQYVSDNLGNKHQIKRRNKPHQIHQDSKTFEREKAVKFKIMKQKKHIIAEKAVIDCVMQQFTDSKIINRIDKQACYSDGTMININQSEIGFYNIFKFCQKKNNKPRNYT